MSWFRATCISNFAQQDRRDFLSIMNLGIFYDAKTYECGNCEFKFTANSNNSSARCPACGGLNAL